MVDLLLSFFLSQSSYLHMTDSALYEVRDVLNRRAFPGASPPGDVSISLINSKFRGLTPVCTPFRNNFSKCLWVERDRKLFVYYFKGTSKVSVWEMNFPLILHQR